MKTAIVILNWNGRKFLEKYLPTLIGETPKETKIVIADNGSEDGSIDWIENTLIPKYKSNSKNVNLRFPKASSLFFEFLNESITP